MAAKLLVPDFPNATKTAERCMEIKSKPNEDIIIRCLRVIQRDINYSADNNEFQVEVYFTCQDVTYGIVKYLAKILEEIGYEADALKVQTGYKIEISWEDVVDSCVHKKQSYNLSRYYCEYAHGLLEQIIEKQEDKEQKEEEKHEDKEKDQ